MTRPENPYFARAVVNRVWGEFFGRGIVHPVDDFRELKPASNDELLTWVAKDFVAHGYDLKHLMRRILDSSLYPGEFPAEQDELGRTTRTSPGACDADCPPR